MGGAYDHGKSSVAKEVNIKATLAPADFIAGPGTI